MHEAGHDMEAEPQQGPQNEQNDSDPDESTHEALQQ